MKKINNLVVLIAMFALFSGFVLSAETVTPSGKIVSRTYNNIRGFNGISVSQGIEVKYTQSNDVSIRVELPENLVKYLDVKKSGNSLSISFSENAGSVTRKCRTKVYVSAPGVIDFKASSAAEIKCQSLAASDKNVSVKSSSGAEVEFDRLLCRSLGASSSSAGEITVKNLSADVVAASVSSGAEIELEGKASQATYSASSGGSISADDLAVSNAKASASSGGSISTNARHLDSSTSSGGRVN